ncbi:MAG TPA: cytochrome c oxidase subunit I, partial [Bdellovibrionota bacterium]|nr:cytochrome c oxidase subunit I [Bdellovibrionota bacterium]
HGMPRRYHSYLPEFQNLHVLSTIGAYLLGLGLFTMAGYLLGSLLFGKKSPQDPWGGRSLEWQTATPPPEHNFAEQPVVKWDPYHFPEMRHDEKKGSHKP